MEAGTLAVSGEAGASGDARSGTHWAAAAAMTGCGPTAASYPPQPLFTTRKLTTSATSGAGMPVLLGTMNQPRETGVNDRKDDGHTSLAYIRVTPVRP